MEVLKIDREQWKESFSENAHYICFGEKKERQEERMDYVLFICDEESPLGYITAFEIDPRTVYWQFGGIFPKTKGSIKSWTAFRAAVDWTKGRYQKVNAYISNHNVVAIKFALNAGFKIVGVRNRGDGIYLEILLDMSDIGKTYDYWKM